MLYATINKDRWDSLPAEWDKTQDMFKYLQRMAWGYQLTMETRMFNTEGSYPYQCTLIKWSDARVPKPINVIDGRTREVLLETTDHTQMEAALFMLINEVEPAYKELLNNQRVSMVP